jgi:pimeloyl-ACP methyl ester carboxylesterase
VTTELDVTVDGGTVHAYDTGPVGDDELVVVWHHGTPNIGTPPAPLAAASAGLGIRWIGFDRPGYGGSTGVADRAASVAATCAAAVADALQVERFAVMSHSGGGPHALACAGLLGGRVRAAAVLASLAPFDAPGLDWFAGMGPAGVATLRAAAAGRAARERHEVEAGDGPPDFVDADLAALRGEWGWFVSVVGPALAAGPGPMIDDDLAYVRPWGVAVDDVAAPVLVVHGSADLVVPSGHGVWLAEHLPTAELWLSPEDGHISVMRRAAEALAWLRAAA